MTDRLHTALTAAIDHLEWFKIPHTMDRVIGLHAEAIANQTMRYRHGVSNDEMVASQRASATGAGGHTDPAWSDPTGDAVATHIDRTNRTDDSDETLCQIDHDLDRLDEAARQLDRLGTTAAGHAHWDPPASGYGRQGTLAVVVSRLHHARPNLTAAALADPDLVDELVRLHIAEPAEWLQAKCEDIWRASRGDTQPVAIQRAIVECRICGTWRRGTIAVAAGRCEECSNFFRNHQCEATEAIVRRWGYNKGPTPGQMLEAKAASRKRKRASA